MSDSNHIKKISQMLVFENSAEQTNSCVPDIVRSIIRTITFTDSDEA